MDRINKNLVFFDFETDSLDVSNLNIVQLSFMILKSLDTKFYSKKLLIKFPFLFDDITESQKKALSISGIFSQKDIDVHNQNAVSVDCALEIFINSVQSIFDFQDFVLVGFNNFFFDNKILNHFLNLYFPDKAYSIMQNNSFDVLFFIRNACHYDLSKLIFEKNFLYINRSLVNSYYHIFRKNYNNAHDSLADVRATAKLFYYYYYKFPNILSVEMEKIIPVYDCFSNVSILNKKKSIVTDFQSYERSK